MNAKEMFEKLGYKKRAFGDCIFYEKGSIMRHIIQFNLKEKIFYSYTSCGMANQIKSLTANELKAVRQQMEELWVDLMNDIKIPSIEFVRLKKGMTDSELNDYIAENDDYSFLVYLRYKYDFEEEWTYSTECAAWNACEDCVSWLNDWHEGQQNVEYLAISKLGEEYDC